ncbi:MAG: glycosyltransferase family 2 protein [Holosporales bacterium]|jgi:glycosyltransferase involved in cell wall biosynthesis|nr:glycosyltransferase family 2 protein [Holosporales bacterium]
MISVVIAAYNEEDAVKGTIARVQEVCEGMQLPFEIIVVDDGSTDATVSVLKEFNVKIVHHPHNVGYGHSLKDGIRAAQYNTIVITDADLTYPFDRVPDLYKEYLKGFDMVVGARMGENYAESALKSPLRKILRFIVEFTAGRKIPDINSGLRIFERDTVKFFFNLLCNGFSFTTSLTLGYMMVGKFVSYIPISYDKRLGRSKVKLFRDSLRTLQYILQVATYYNPLKVFLLFSALCVLSACMGFMISFVGHLRGGFFFGIGSLLIALLVLCLGLFADLLKQLLNKER